MTRTAPADAFKKHVTQAFYWHGLQVASKPFQVILTAAVFAILFSIPAAVLVVSQWRRWQPQIWHDPMADASSPTGVHVDVLPSLFRTRPSSEAAAASFRVLQIHVGLDESKDAISNTTWMMAAHTLPDFLETQFARASPSLHEDWLSHCVRYRDDAGHAKCVVIHPGMFVNHGGDPGSTAPSTSLPSPLRIFSRTVGTNSDAADGEDGAWVLSSMSSAGLASIPLHLAVPGDAPTFPVTKDLVCHNRRHRFERISCETLVISLIMKPSVPQEFRAGLRAVLEQNVQGLPPAAPTTEGTTNLYYVLKSFYSSDSLLLGLAYLVLALYMASSLSGFDRVKSRFGLIFTALAIIAASVTSGIGTATYFGFVRRFEVFDVLPFLIMVIGMDSYSTITTVIVSVPRDIAVRYRIAEGLSQAGPKLTLNLFLMEVVLLIGAFTHIPQLRQFSIVSCVAILCNFAFQIVVYVGALSLDLRRLELSDLLDQSGGVSAAKRSPRAAVNVVGKSDDDSFITEMVKSIKNTDRFVLNTVLVILSMGAITLIAVLSGTNGHAVEGYIEPSLDGQWLTFARIQPSSLMQGTAMPQSPHEPPPPSPPPPPLNAREQPFFGKALVSNVIKFDPVILFNIPMAPQTSSFQGILPLDVTFVGVVQFLIAAVVVAFVVYYMRIFLVATRQALFGVREDVDSLAAMSLLNIEMNHLAQSQQQLELLCLNDDYKLVVGCSMGGVVSLWDLQTQRTFCTLRDKDASFLDDVPLSSLYATRDNSPSAAEAHFDGQGLRLGGISGNVHQLPSSNSFTQGNAHKGSKLVRGSHAGPRARPFDHHIRRHSNPKSTTQQTAVLIRHRRTCSADKGMTGPTLGKRGASPHPTATPVLTRSSSHSSLQAEGARAWHKKAATQKKTDHGNSSSSSGNLRALADVAGVAEDDHRHSGVVRGVGEREEGGKGERGEALALDHRSPSSSLLHNPSSPLALSVAVGGKATTSQSHVISPRTTAAARPRAMFTVGESEDELHGSSVLNENRPRHAEKAAESSEGRSFANNAGNEGHVKDHGDVDDGDRGDDAADEEDDNSSTCTVHVHDDDDDDDDAKEDGKEENGSLALERHQLSLNAQQLLQHRAPALSIMSSYNDAGDGDEYEDDSLPYHVGFFGAGSVRVGDVPWCITSHKNLIAIGFSNGIVEVWEIHSHQRHVLQPSSSINETTYAGVTQVVFCGSALFIACDDGVVEAWTVQYEAPGSSHLGHPPPRKPHWRRHRRTLSAESTSSAISTSNSELIICYDSSLNLADNYPPVSFKHAFVMKCHTGSVPCMVACHDVVVSGGQDAVLRTIRETDMAVTSKLIGHKGAITCLTPFSGPTQTSSKSNWPISDTVVASGSEDGDVCVWDMRTKQQEVTFTASEGSITQIAVNSVTVISLSDQHTLRFWSRQTRRCLRTVQASDVGPFTS